MGNTSKDLKKEAEHIMELASQKAREFKHNYVDTEHILLALVVDEGGEAAKLLSDCGLKPDQIRAALEFVIGRGDPAAEEWLGLTSRATRVIDLAQLEACMLASSYCGSEHLLLGLLRESEGLAAAILGSLVGTRLYTKLRDILRSRCPRCSGNVTTTMIDYPVPSKDRVVIIRNVPAQVCSQCGEIVEVQLDFSLKKKLLRLTESSPVPRRTVEVPVYDIGDIR